MSLSQHIAGGAILRLMRRHWIWYLIATGWLLDAAFVYYRGHPARAAFICVFACGFCLIGYFWGWYDQRKCRERSALRS